MRVIPARGPDMDALLLLSHIIIPVSMIRCRYHAIITSIRTSNRIPVNRVTSAVKCGAMNRLTTVNVGRGIPHCGIIHSSPPGYKEQYQKMRDGNIPYHPPPDIDDGRYGRRHGVSDRPVFKRMMSDTEPIGLEPREDEIPVFHFVPTGIQHRGHNLKYYQKPRKHDPGV